MTSDLVCSGFNVLIMHGVCKISESIEHIYMKHNNKLLPTMSETPQCNIVDGNVNMMDVVVDPLRNEGYKTLSIRISLQI